MNRVWAVPRFSARSRRTRIRRAAPGVLLPAPTSAGTGSTSLLPAQQDRHSLFPAAVHRQRCGGRCRSLRAARRPAARSACRVAIRFYSLTSPVLTRWLSGFAGLPVRRTAAHVLGRRFASGPYPAMSGRSAPHPTGTPAPHPMRNLGVPSGTVRRGATRAETRSGARTHPRPHYVERNYCQR